MAANKGEGNVTETTETTPAPEPGANILGGSKVIVREPKSRKTSEAREPQMRALRRILGDVVLDIFPEDLIKSVDAAYDHWTEHPDSYLVTEFDTEAEKDSSLTVMRAYAECAGKKGYTVRVVADDDPTRLIWRVQNRRGTSDSN